MRGVRQFYSSGLISILSLETNQQREVVPQLSGFRWPRFSPEGQLIVQGSTENGEPKLFKLDETTGAASPYVGKEGSRRVFVGTADEPRLRNPDTGEEKTIYRAPQPVNRASISGWQEQRLAFFAGNALIVAHASGEVRELLRLKEPERSHLNSQGTEWALDGC